MGNIISTELLKIKRYSVVKAGLVMMSLSVLMSCFYSTASTNKVWDFQYFIQQVIISNCTLFFPIIITLVAVYIISREKGINMSALNGQEGEQYPILIPRLKNAGTSNMHYEYERPITQWLCKK